MRASVLLAWLALAGCGGPQLLTTTIFHAPLTRDATLDDADWARLATAASATSVDHVLARTPLDEDTWMLWLGGESRAGALVRARRTDVGLEAQSIGAHVGPSIRPSIRALSVGLVRVVVVESSSAVESTERDAWLYVERGSEIVPLSLDGGAAHLRVRAERRVAIDRSWSRASTLTATFDVGAHGLVVHEHASVREIATDRPELPPRSTYEVERARNLTGHGTTLVSDRPSLFDEPS
jgi:hypothetical protein